MKQLLFITLTIFFLLGCSGEQKETATPIIEEDYPDQESWDATILITREGQTIGYLKAGHIQKFTKKNLTLLLDSIKVDFYDEEGQHTSILTSLGGKVFDLTQDMLAYGNVVVISDSGMTLYTDTLKWNNEEQKIISEIPIKVTTEEGDTLYGDSFKSDPNLKNREITNPRGKSSKSIDLD